MTIMAPDPLRATAPRRIGGRILGPLLPYLLHLRPAEWPVMAAHTATGWLLASGFRMPVGIEWTGFAAWVIALNGGTLALNSAFDRDEGDIAYLRSPPKPPPGLAAFGIALMIAGLAVSWSLGPLWRALYLTCFGLSVVYSVPPIRLKAVAGVDWLINMVGFGALTAWAGWVISGRTLELSYGLVIAAFCPLFAGLYPLTQLYQIDHDRARGDRTFSVRLGVRNSLRVAVISVMVAFAILAAAAWQADWGHSPMLRWTVLVLAFAAWLTVLIPWRHDGWQWSSDEHQRGMYHALAAWALTDVAVLVAWLG